MNYMIGPSEVETVQMDAPHNYNQASREAMYTFFNHRIQGERKDVKERQIEIEKLQDLLVWEGAPLPANSLTYDQLERNGSLRRGTVRGNAGCGSIAEKAAAGVSD